jgi:hypothetical protein
VATDLAEHILDLVVWSDGSREALMCRELFIFFMKNKMKIMVQGQDLLYIREYQQLRKQYFLVPGGHINSDSSLG